MVRAYLLCYSAHIFKKIYKSTYTRFATRPFASVPITLIPEMF